MSAVIKVENLGKKYLIRHQQRERYVALRDIMAKGIKSFGRKILSPITHHPSPVTVSKEEFWALKDVSFEINQGDRVGIIGRNGAGKTTLLKLISRITEPTTGRITLKRRVASLLEVGTGFHPELTGRENIFLNGAILGMGRVEIKKKFDEIVDFAEVEKFLDTPVKRYSSGMYVRLAFAVAAHLESEILIVDEVLAVGDAQFQKKCIGKMEEIGKEGRTVLFVSHNMGVIKNLCNGGILLNKGEIGSCGDVSKIVDEYEQISLNLSAKENLPRGVLFSKQANPTTYDICEISVRDRNGQLVQQVRTLDSFAFRIRFYSPKIQKNASVALSINNRSGTTLLRFATRPDSCLDVDFKEGINEIICNVRNIPLPAGTYILGVGLAIPMREWLRWEKELCYFEIGDRDIYGSGFPPTEQYAAAVTRYNWDIIE